MSNLPGVPYFTYYDLKLPVWRTRATQDYTAVHALLWQVYSRAEYAACKDSRHAAYRPSQKYRNKNAHKLFYSVHCSLKDTFYMLTAVHMGVPAVCTQNYIPYVALGPVEFQEQVEALEGHSIFDKITCKNIKTLVKDFLQACLNASSYRLDLIQAPCLPVLFGDSLSSNERQSFLNNVFNSVARKLVKTHATTHNTLVPKPLLIKAATALGEANFTLVTLSENVVQLKQTVFLAKFNRGLTPIVPENVSIVYLPYGTFKGQINELRTLRHNYPAANTARLILENIFPSPVVGKIRTLLGKIRVLFTITEIVVVTYSWRVNKILEKFKAKYKIRILYLETPGPTVLVDNYPHLFRTGH